jgi:hypothetical protein
MSYKNDPEKVTGIRKVKWDELWHIVYLVKGQESYDRVSREEALAVESKWEKWGKS